MSEQRLFSCITVSQTKDSGGQKQGAVFWLRKSTWQEWRSGRVWLAVETQSSSMRLELPGEACGVWISATGKVSRGRT